MDWDRVVEGNAKRLRRILATLVAMAGLSATLTSPLWGGRREASGGGSSLPVTPHPAVCRPTTSPQGGGGRQRRPDSPPPSVPRDPAPTSPTRIRHPPADHRRRARFAGSGLAGERGNVGLA